MKTTFAVRPPSVCETQDGKNVQFHIHFDRTEGHLPFLIGLPSLKSMAGNLSLRQKSVLMVVFITNNALLWSKALYQIQLFDKRLNFYLPLQPNSIFSMTVSNSLNVILPA